LRKFAAQIRPPPPPLAWAWAWVQGQGQGQEQEQGRSLRPLLPLSMHSLLAQVQVQVLASRRQNCPFPPPLPTQELSMSSSDTAILPSRSHLDHIGHRDTKFEFEFVIFIVTIITNIDSLDGLMDYSSSIYIIFSFSFQFFLFPIA
jgi:hypothetical protein